MLVACPDFKIPNRHQLRDGIVAESHIVKGLIKSKTVACKNPSYCADLWKSKARDYYVGVTMQVIDDDWRLFNLPIAFAPIIGPHTAQAVGNLVADLITPYLGQGCTPFAGVIDGGDIASVKYTAASLNCTIHDQTCICHRLNNMIKRLLKDYLGDEELPTWRRFIKRIRKSHPFAELWSQSCQQLYGADKVLQLDTETRWSSCVNMISKAVVVRKAVERMFHLTNEPERREHHEFVPNFGDENSHVWLVLKQVSELFGPTAESIMALEGEKYVTQSLILLELNQLEKSASSTAQKYSADDDRNDVFFVLLKDLQESIAQLWRELPVDTVIASVLDPRTKWNPKIPPKEIAEALKHLQKEYVALVRTEISDDREEMNSTDHFDVLFADIPSVSRKSTPSAMWKHEIELYQSVLRPPGKANPLEWWKNNQIQFPYLAQLAKMYLCIPASQASCERLFSISQNDITDNRTCLLPDITESLLFVRKKKDIIELC